EEGINEWENNNAIHQSMPRAQLFPIIFPNISAVSIGWPIIIGARDRIIRAISTVPARPPAIASLDLVSLSFSSFHRNGVVRNQKCSSIFISLLLVVHVNSKFIFPNRWAVNVGMTAPPCRPAAPLTSTVLFVLTIAHFSSCCCLYRAWQPVHDTQVAFQRQSNLETTSRCYEQQVELASGTDLLQDFRVFRPETPIHGHIFNRVFIKEDQSVTDVIGLIDGGGDLFHHLPFRL